MYSRSMKVLIAEFFWQHTEVLGTWIDYFCRRGDSITIFYPELLKTPHNYVGIWEHIYDITVNYNGHINMFEFDLIVVNTQQPELITHLRTFGKPIIEVNHYAVAPASAAGQEIAGQEIAGQEIAVNPFRRLPSGKQQFVLPVCPALADTLADTRRGMPVSRVISIIGNSFLALPAHLFKNLTTLLSRAGWTIQCVIYDYNNIDEYRSEHVIIKQNCLARELFDQVKNSRFILFCPGAHHFYNQLSGAIILSLLFGRPLITVSDVLSFYNITTHYNINNLDFLSKLDDEAYYMGAQRHLEVRLNEFIAAGRQTLGTIVEQFVGSA